MHATGNFGTRTNTCLKSGGTFTLRMEAALGLVLCLVCAPSVHGQAPTITNVTNAAIPALDFPPNSINLAPRSMASILGTNLADGTVSTTPPWKRILGGTEVHFVVDAVVLPGTPGISAFDSFPCDWRTDPHCDLTLNLIYVSPTQINFVTPDASITLNDGLSHPFVSLGGRIMLVRDGVRFDGRYDIFGGPGYVGLTQDIGDFDVVFGVGYDCLFSFSLTNPSACGVSWTQGQNRALLGAVTDASGQLITSKNPVRQGELITLWMTGLTGLVLDSKTGLLQQTRPRAQFFGVAQYGKDLVGIAGPPTIWAGESPQFVGLDQVNLNFPVCAAKTQATVEQRYDAFLAWSSIVTNYQTEVRVYLPLLISPGDPDCQSGWGVNSTTTVTSSVNPSVSGQLVTFTATVSPSTATGTVTFFDGTAVLGSGTLSSSKATCSTSSLAIGSHSITATYNGDTTYGGSSATRTQTVKTNTATTLTSSINPSAAGQPVTFTATVLPSTATGTVSFLDGTRNASGAVTLSNGKAIFSTSSLGAGGVHSMTAVYSGDNIYSGSTSAVLTQIIILNTTTTLTSSLSPSILGQPVTFTATVSPCCIATGTVTFFDGSGTLGSGTLVNLRAAFSTSSLSLGNHSIMATYSGDSNDSASSATVSQTVTAH
jgi:hypothetical protein